MNYPRCSLKFSLTLQGRLLFCIRFISVGFFYFEGHIIFYSFCFALTCEMSLILNSPSYFCVWLNTYAKRVEFSFYIRLLRRSNAVGRGKEYYNAIFCMQSFFKLDGKNLFLAHLLHPSFIKMQNVLRRTNRKFKN